MASHAGKKGIFIEFLFRLLIKLLKRQRFIIRQKYNRSLPVDDLIFDRWDVASFNGFGAGTSCYASVLVIGDVKVGNDCWIGPNVILDGSSGLYIGKNVNISAGVQIYTHDTVQKTITMGSEDISLASTTIGDGVYIGPNAIIEKGITIGDRAIVGAGSLVNKSIPSDCRYYGTELIE